jgi:hypothetical protein
MDWDILVVREGDRVTASGRLVRNESGDWLEPLLFGTGLPRGIRPVSGCAVRVTGADFDALSHRREDDGAVEGYTRLTGIWSADQLRTERQTPPGNGHRRSPRWVTPPCAAPVGGWPRLTGGHDDKNLHYDPGDLIDSGAAVAMTTFRPSEDQAVLVIAATDRDAVEARLRPQLGQRLCVVASRWTKAELDGVRAHLDAHHEQWNLLQLGPFTRRGWPAVHGSQADPGLARNRDVGRLCPHWHPVCRPLAPSRGSRGLLTGK